MKRSLVLIALFSLLAVGCGCDCPPPDETTTVATVTVSNDVVWDKDGCAYLRQRYQVVGYSRYHYRDQGRLPSADLGTPVCAGK